MERQFNNQDFEKLLRDNANQYRMYPSEKVWTGVYSALHSRRKWYRISALALLFISAAVISILALNYPTDKAVTAEFNTALPDANVQTESIKQTAEQKTIQQGQAQKSYNTIQHLPDRNDLIAKEQITTPVEIIDNSTENISTKNEADALVVNSETIDQNNSDELQTDLINHNIIPIEKLQETLIEEKEEQTINSDSKINDVINALASYNAPAIKGALKSRLTAQVYITPTVSYRKLSENKSLISNNNSYNSQFLNVNNVVDHKPLLGFEFGVEGIYKINKKVSFKTGFQFNINRYDIKAYSHSTEVATVAFNSGYRTSYISTLSNNRNFNGNTVNWLENFYFQAAIPIGLELILAERKNISWGISGTLQPTYVIGDRAYLISSDYKNYAKFPDLMRRWNLSSGFETFVSYSTGKIKWQTGPHVRYQHLSSFVSGYPVKENLFAVGLKVAATFNRK